MKNVQQKLDALTRLLEDQTRLLQLHTHCEDNRPLIALHELKGAILHSKLNNNKNIVKSKICKNCDDIELHLDEECADCGRSAL